VRTILDKAYARTHEILTNNLDKLHAMSELLLEYETIDVPQIDAIMEGRPPPPPMGWEETVKKRNKDEGNSDGNAPQPVAAATPPPIGGTAATEQM